MATIQIHVEDRQIEKLNQLAESENISISEIISKSIDLFLREVSTEKDPAWNIIGLGRSSITDGSVNHDEYIIQEVEKVSEF